MNTGQSGNKWSRSVPTALEPVAEGKGWGLFLFGDYLQDLFAQTRQRLLLMVDRLNDWYSSDAQVLEYAVGFCQRKSDAVLRRGRYAFSMLVESSPMRLMAWASVGAKRAVTGLAAFDVSYYASKLLTDTDKAVDGAPKLLVGSCMCRYGSRHAELRRKTPLMSSSA